MAPTELLAQQHFRKLANLNPPAASCVAWLTGSKKERATEMVALGHARQAALVVARTR